MVGIAEPPPPSETRRTARCLSLSITVSQPATKTYFLSVQRMCGGNLESTTEGNAIMLIMTPQCLHNQHEKCVLKGRKGKVAQSVCGCECHVAGDNGGEGGIGVTADLNAAANPDPDSILPVDQNREFEE